LLDPLEKANHALSAGRLDSALEYIEDAIYFDPALHHIHLRAAEIALTADKPQAALSHFLAAPEDADGSSYGKCLHAQIRLALGDALSAADAWSDAPVDCPGYKKYLYDLADRYRSEGSVQALKEVLEKLVINDPADIAAHLSLAILTAVIDPEVSLSLLRQTNELVHSDNDLVADLIRAIENARLENESAYTFAQVGQILATYGEWDYAIWAFQEAIALYPDYLEARAYLGLALDQAGQDGLEELKGVVSDIPNAALPRIFLAMHWQKTGNFEEARLELSIAARLDPTNPAIAAELGKAYTALGDVESAKDAFLLATQLAPQDPNFWMLLANFSVMNEIEVNSLGLPAARNSVALAPNNPATLDTLGYAHLVLGNLRLAERILWRAVELQPRRAWTHYHVGLLRSVQGDGGRARSAWQLATLLDPDGPAGELAQRALNHQLP
jgi:tetratricopeptide (TPR) repeat protein